jgi:hypothetical protein
LKKYRYFFIELEQRWPTHFFPGMHLEKNAKNTDFLGHILTKTEEKCDFHVKKFLRLDFFKIYVLKYSKLNENTMKNSSEKSIFKFHNIFI